MTSNARSALSARSVSLLRQALVLGMLALLAACANEPSRSNMPVLEEQAHYRAHARSYYAPPGPATDPWGPYIREASARFDVPDVWIRAVIHQESGGHLYDKHGQFITSAPGAMGLMQLMPPAYDDMRTQYGLGSDPYDPRDNIMAGTAYIRQMYDIYGTPGFLAAYNDGPGNVDHYLRQNRTLPRETRNYVAAIGPHLVGYYPVHRSQADLLVSQHDSTAQPPGGAYANAAYQGQSYEGAAYQGSPSADQAAPTADALNARVISGTSTQSVSAAWAARGFTPPAASPPPPPPPAIQAAVRAPAPPPRPPAAAPPSASYALQEQDDRPVRIRSIPLAQSPAPRGRVSDIPSMGGWSVQIGSYNSRQQAATMAQRLRRQGGSAVLQARTTIMPVQAGRKVLYRTRLTGLSQIQAKSACKRISPCMALSPHSRF